MPTPDEILSPWEERWCPDPSVPLSEKHRNSFKSKSTTRHLTAFKHSEVSAAIEKYQKLNDILEEARRLRSVARSDFLIEYERVHRPDQLRREQEEAQAEQKEAEAKARRLAEHQAEVDAKNKARARDEAEAAASWAARKGCGGAQRASQCKACGMAPHPTTGRCLCS